MSALVGKTMLTAVEFDVQLRLLAKEIEKVFSNGMLPAKFVAAKAPVAQPAPHELFRPCLNLAQMTGAFSIGHE